MSILGRSTFCHDRQLSLLIAIFFFLNYSNTIILITIAPKLTFSLCENEFFREARN